MGFRSPFTNATNNSNFFGDNQRPDILADPTLGTKSIYKWVNTGDFEQPAPFTFGDVPRALPYLRARGTLNTDMTLQKCWVFGTKRRSCNCARNSIICLTARDSSLWGRPLGARSSE